MILCWQQVRDLREDEGVKAGGGCRDSVPRGSGSLFEELGLES